MRTSQGKSMYESKILLFSLICKGLWQPQKPQPKVLSLSGGLQWILEHASIKEGPFFGGRKEHSDI